LKQLAVSLSRERRGCKMKVISHLHLVLKFENVRSFHSHLRFYGVVGWHMDDFGIQKKEK
jgi:hypothetical protein